MMVACGGWGSGKKREKKRFFFSRGRGGKAIVVDVVSLMEIDKNGRAALLFFLDFCSLSTGEEHSATSAPRWRERKAEQGNRSERGRERKGERHRFFFFLFRRRRRRLFSFSLFSLKMNERTCQWKRSSPAGPAEQDVGGSFWRSCSSCFVFFHRREGQTVRQGSLFDQLNSDGLGSLSMGFFPSFAFSFRPPSGTEKPSLPATGDGGQGESTRCSVISKSQRRSKEAQRRGRAP